MRSVTKHLSLLFGLAATSLTPGYAQDGLVGRNQFSVDIGVIEGGLSYARRLGRGPISIGGGVWGAWSPWSTFKANVFEPMGVELFVRAQPAGVVQLELGPSLLRYYWSDDCSACSGTFAGIRAAAMVGKGIFWLGPTARIGRTSGDPAGSETGIIWGAHVRLLVPWGK